MSDQVRDFDAAEFAREFNHLTPEYADHYREVFAHMRRNCPIAHTNALGGFWVATRYWDIMQIARDDDTFASLYGNTINVRLGDTVTSDVRLMDADFDEEKAARSATGPLNPKTGPLAELPLGPNGEEPRLTSFPIDLDPPFHKPYRRVLDPMFTPRAMAELEPWFDQLATNLIDDVIESGQGDFSRDFGTPMTSIYTMKVAGLPLEDWADYAYVMQSSIGGSSSVEPRTPGVTGAELRERVAAEVAKARTKVRPDSAIAVLVDAEVDGRKLLDWEIEAYVWLLIAGGVDTTQACMGSMFVWLARNSDRRQHLIDHPEDLPDAIEECLRVFAPQQALARTVMKDTEVAGQKLKRGDRVLMCWSSANLDESEFPNPEEVDFQRENKRHMAFGVGIHRCMGSNVARMEFRVLFREILKRMPDYRVDEGNLHRSPVAGIVFGYESAPFTFTPGKRIGAPRIV